MVRLEDAEGRQQRPRAELGHARKILSEVAGDLDDLRPTSQDCIILFGFSRDAALARKFASRTLERHPNLQIAFSNMAPWS